jgi:hypothetical protein
MRALIIAISWGLILEKMGSIDLIGVDLYNYSYNLYLLLFASMYFIVGTFALLESSKNCGTSTATELGLCSLLGSCMYITSAFILFRTLDPLILPVNTDRYYESKLVGFYKFLEITASVFILYTCSLNAFGARKLWALTMILTVQPKLLSLRRRFYSLRHTVKLWFEKNIK